MGLRVYGVFVGERGCAAEAAKNNGYWYGWLAYKNYSSTRNSTCVSVCICTSTQYSVISYGTVMDGSVSPPVTIEHST